MDGLAFLTELQTPPQQECQTPEFCSAYSFYSAAETQVDTADYDTVVGTAV